MVRKSPIFGRIQFWLTTERIVPDIHTSHFKLYYKRMGYNRYNKRFKYFGEDSEFRSGTYAIACSNISIGNRVIIRPTTMLFAEPIYEDGFITIEDKALLESGLHIYTTNHKFDDPNQLILDQSSIVMDVILKRGCWLGANVIVLPG